MITNLVEKKRYIGKTTKTINERWKKHLSVCTPDNVHASPRLNEAIITYGSDNFTIEEIIKANFEHLDYYEKKFISLYQTTDDRFGYNIAFGGTGRSVKDVKISTREKMSTSQRVDPAGILNITPDYRDGKHVGYRVRRTLNHKEHNKRFTNSKYSLDQLYVMAQNWLASFEESKTTDHDVSYNKESALPKYIYLKKNKKTGEPSGFEVMMTHNKIRYNKTFTKGPDLEKNLQLAKDYVQYLNTTVKTAVTSSKEEQDNPQPTP